CPACRPSPPAGAERQSGRARNPHREGFSDGAPSPPPRDRRRLRWPRGTRRSAARRPRGPRRTPTNRRGRPPHPQRRWRAGPPPARSPVLLAQRRELAGGVDRRELLEPADRLAVDEYLRHGTAPGSTDDVRAQRRVTAHIGLVEGNPAGGKQPLRTHAVRTPRRRVD